MNATMIQTWHEAVDNRIRNCLYGLDTSCPLTSEEKAYLLRACRVTLENLFANIKTQPSDFEQIPEALLNRQAKVFVSLYCGHQIRGCQSALGENLLESAIQATRKAARENRFGGKLKRSELDSVHIDITLLLEPQELTGMDYQQLKGEIELGVHALSLEQGEHRGFFKSSVPVSYGYDLRTTLKRLGRKAGLDKNAYTDPNTRLFKYETLQFAETIQHRFGQRQVRSLYRNHRPFCQEDVNRHSLENALRLAGSFMKHHTTPKGRLTYEYFPQSDERVFSNNNSAVLRRMASTWMLAEVGRYTGDPGMVKAAQRSVTHMIERYYRYDEEKDFGYLETPGKTNIGLAGFTMLTLNAIKEISEAQWAIRHNLAKFVLAQEDPEEGFLYPMYPPVKGPSFESKQLYYPGEAMTALMMLFQSTGNYKYKALVERVFPYYRNIFRTSDKRLNMAAWMSKPYARLYYNTGNAEYADFVFEINDTVAAAQHGLEELYPDKIGCFSKSGNCCATAVFLESVAEGLFVAKLVGDTYRIERYTRCLMMGLRFVLQCMYWPDEGIDVPNPRLTWGDVRTSVTNGGIRIDNVQHAASAILRSLQTLDLSY